MDLVEAVDNVLAEKKRSVAYAGIFLDPASTRKLLSWWRSNVEPVLGQVHAHHMTAIFRPKLEAMEGLGPLMGAPVRLRVVGYATDGSVQAVKVDGFGMKVPGSNRDPHITVATDGAKPMLSNALLARALVRVKGPTLEGRLGYEEKNVVKFSWP